MLRQVRVPVSAHSVVLQVVKRSPGEELRLQRLFIAVPDRQKVEFIQKRSVSPKLLTISFWYGLGVK